ncbi:hypothetical protein [Amycolatopsis magusensis]|uniref:Small integral membrane protein n=1 Tax=Amycolatopsis magusensis TaxID=882444 RepID=A0ABS4PSY1_9PSEU|nr:hypothetical protein [Amycolatopsis magusensis]MBP2181706.1 putative small integral membrane protein [Amycolatopsis magusensis]
MKLTFLILGFLFLGSAFALGAIMADEARLAGMLEWTCRPPNSVGWVECHTTKSDDTFLRLDADHLVNQILLGLTGVGCLIAAAAVGPRQPRPVPRALTPPQWQQVR